MIHQTRPNAKVKFDGNLWYVYFPVRTEDGWVLAMRSRWKSLLIAAEWAREKIKAAMKDGFR